MNMRGTKVAVGHKWNKLNKLPALYREKVKPKAGAIRQAENDGEMVHYASLMELCHWKNAELATHLQQCKGRIVLREDIVKDEEGHRAVFTDQSASVFTSGNGEVHARDIKTSWHLWRSR